MTKPISEGRRPGRPATGTDPMTGVRLRPEIIAAIDAIAVERNATRAGLIRGWIIKELEQAASEAGFIRKPTVLQTLERLWSRASLEERTAFAKARGEEVLRSFGWQPSRQDNE